MDEVSTQLLSARVKPFLPKGITRNAKITNTSAMGQRISSSASSRCSDDFGSRTARVETPAHRPKAAVDSRFTVDDARIELKRLYPSIED